MKAIAGAALLIAVYVAPEHDDTGMRMLMGFMVGMGIALLFASVFEGDS